MVGNHELHSGDFAEWQAEIKEKNAERAAEDAEDDAVVA